MSPICKYSVALTARPSDVGRASRPVVAPDYCSGLASSHLSAASRHLIRHSSLKGLLR